MQYIRCVYGEKEKHTRIGQLETRMSVDNTECWSVVIATAFLLLLLHTIFQTIATTPTDSLTPPFPPIMLSDALRLMGNGDILLCYPTRGGDGSLLGQIKSKTICVISQSLSGHVAMVVHGRGSDGWVVLENSAPKIRLIPIDQYVRLCHSRGLCVTRRPLRNAIPHTITDCILDRVIGQHYPTPLQMFAQTIAVLNDSSYRRNFMGNPVCTGLIIDILRTAGMIPIDVDTRTWTTDSLSSRCWPPDRILGHEMELIWAESDARLTPTHAD